MKKIFFRKQSIISLIAAIGVTVILSSYKKNEVLRVADDLKGTINISGAFALYPITVKWAQEFKKIHPGLEA